MNFLRHRYQSWLVPYAEGTLDPDRQAKLEGQIRRDPALAAEAEAHRRAAARMRAMSSAVKSAPEEADATLWPAIQARLQPHRRTIAPLVLAGGLCAAACALVFVDLHGVSRYFTNSTLRTAAISQGIAPDEEGATVEGMGNRHHRKYLHHTPRHARAVVAARPASEPKAKSSLPDPRNSAIASTDGSEAAAGANPAGLNSADGSAYPAPKLVVGAATHFRLAPLIRPLNPNANSSEILPEGQDRSIISAAPPAAAADGEGVPDAVADAPNAIGAASKPSDSAAIQGSPASSHRARHRRDKHRRSAAARSAAKAAVAAPRSRDAKTAPSADSASSAVDSPVGLKVRPSLIE